MDGTMPFTKVGGPNDTGNSMSATRSCDRALAFDQSGMAIVADRQRRVPCCRRLVECDYLRAGLCRLLD